jgi:hypothetical protein
LNALIPQLGVTKQNPTKQDLQNIQSRIETAVKDKVAGSNIFDLIAHVADPDDRIGQTVNLFNYSSLFNNPIITWSNSWDQEGQWEVSGRIESQKISEFLPDAEPSPIHLAPVAGEQNLDAWVGAWYGTPEDTGVSAILVRVERAPTPGLNISTVENTRFPAIATQTAGIQPSTEFELRYERDKWTFPLQSGQLQIPRFRPIEPRNPLNMPQTPQTSGLIRNPQAREGQIMHAAVQDWVDRLVLTENVRISLYAEVDANNNRQRYRVRYIRTRDDGSVLEDVMLAQRLIG